MRKLLIISVIGALCTWLPGCNGKQHALEKCWRVGDAWGLEDIWNDSLKREIQEIFTYGYLRLYGNSEYTFITYGNSAIGQWQYDDEAEVLVLNNFVNGHRVRLTVGHGVKSLELKITAIDQHKLHDFLALTLYPCHDFEYNGKDLLTRERNEWRIKPNHVESAEEVKKRLIGCVNFSAEYFNLLLWDSFGTIEPAYLQTEIKLYRHGIGLYNDSTEAKPRWIKCFYNQQNVQMARAMVTKAFGQMGPFESGENYCDEYLMAFRKLSSTLNKMEY